MMATHIFSLELLLFFFLCLTGLGQEDEPVELTLYSGFVQHPTRGLTQISWFYDDNLVIYDGDIIYGTTDEFNEILVNFTYSSTEGQIEFSNRRRNLKRQTSQKLPKRANSVPPLSPAIWPNGNIHYRYFDAATEAIFKTDVDLTIAEWKRNVICLNWIQEPSSADPNGAPGIVTIRSGANCSATLGFSTTALWMTLIPGRCAAAEILHEWGHVLGLIHEHQRTDAFLHTTFVCSNLDRYPFMMTTLDADRLCCTALRCCDQACDFKPDFSSYGLPSPYDTGSLMHYRRNAGAKPGRETLTVGPMNNPTFASPGDIDRVKELYTCPF